MVGDAANAFHAVSLALPPPRLRAITSSWCRICLLLTVSWSFGTVTDRCLLVAHVFGCGMAACFLFVFVFVFLVRMTHCIRLVVLGLVTVVRSGAVVIDGQSARYSSKSIKKRENKKEEVRVFVCGGGG